MSRRCRIGTCAVSTPASRGLHPVALLDVLGNAPTVFGHLGPFEARLGGLLVFGAHVGPNHSAHVHGGISLQLDLFLKLAFSRLVHHIDAVPVHIVLPAMINASKAALFVAPQPEGGTPMGAELVNEADPSRGVPERHQLFPQQLHAHRRAVGFRNLVREAGGNPVSSQGLPHGCTGVRSYEKLVICVELATHTSVTGVVRVTGVSYDLPEYWAVDERCSGKSYAVMLFSALQRSYSWLRVYRATPIVVNEDCEFGVQRPNALESRC